MVRQGRDQIRPQSLLGVLLLLAKGRSDILPAADEEAVSGEGEIADRDQAAAGREARIAKVAFRVLLRCWRPDSSVERRTCELLLFLHLALLGMVEVVVMEVVRVVVVHALDTHTLLHRTDLA